MVLSKRSRKKGKLSHKQSRILITSPKVLDQTPPGGICLFRTKFITKEETSPSQYEGKRKKCVRRYIYKVSDIRDWSWLRFRSQYAADWRQQSLKLELVSRFWKPNYARLRCAVFRLIYMFVTCAIKRDSKLHALSHWANWRLN